jgi:hypothetical protein
MIKLARCASVCRCAGVITSSCLFVAFKEPQADASQKEKYKWDALVEFICRLHNLTVDKTTVELRIFVRELYDQALVSKGQQRQEFSFKIHSDELKTDVKLCRQMFEFCYGLGAGTIARLSKQARGAYDGKPTLYQTYAYGDDTFPGTDMIEAEAVFLRNGIKPGDNKLDFLLFQPLIHTIVFYRPRNGAVSTLPPQ